MLNHLNMHSIKYWSKVKSAPIETGRTKDSSVAVLVSGICSGVMENFYPPPPHLDGIQVHRWLSSSILSCCPCPPPPPPPPPPRTCLFTFIIHLGGERHCESSNLKVFCLVTRRKYSCQGFNSPPLELKTEELITDKILDLN